MKKPQIPKLQQIPPFSGLSPQGREYIQRHLRWVELPQGKTIIRESKRGNFMVVVGRGQVKLSSINGEAQTLQPGDSFGEGMLRYGVPSSFKAVAKSDVWIMGGKTQRLVGRQWPANRKRSHESGIFRRSPSFALEDGRSRLHFFGNFYSWTAPTRDYQCRDERPGARNRSTRSRVRGFAMDVIYQT